MAQKANVFEVEVNILFFFQFDRTNCSEKFLTTRLIEISRRRKFAKFTTYPVTRA